MGQTLIRAQFAFEGFPLVGDHTYESSDFCPPEGGDLATKPQPFIEREDEFSITKVLKSRFGPSFIALKAIFLQFPDPNNPLKQFQFELDWQEARADES